MITQEQLKELLEYDEITGIFIWKIRASSQVYIGDKAGHLDNKGYIRIKIKGKRYQAHTLAFLYIEGFLPDLIDHKNRIRHDNSWDNLRESTPKLNSGNTICNNIFVGVSWNKSRLRWRAYTCISGKRKDLGSFKTNLAACYARHSHDCLGI